MAFDPDVLRVFLQRQKIATLAELKRALASTATMTVFRKLKALGYRTSYSHRGRYYTLLDIARFNERALWSWRSVWFSRDGNLLATAQRFVEESEAGLSAGKSRNRCSSCTVGAGLPARRGAGSMSISPWTRACGGPSTCVVRVRCSR
jgi:hypothetical protein